MEYDSLSGRSYLLGRQIGKGGEGRLYEIVNDRRFVAKLYYPRLRTVHRERKLRIMLLQAPRSEEIDSQFAWPKDILYLNGRMIGFVMRRVDGAPLNSLFDRKDLPLGKRITVAKNLCIAVRALHASGNVIGDVNPENVLVNSAGLVRLIDCDSFQITDKRNNAVYGCEVAKPEYLAPSMARRVPKGESFKSVSSGFNVETDTFSLAVLLFQLLMNGTHPFCCALARGSSSDHVPQPADNIRAGFFPYDGCPSGFRLPIYALPYKLLSEQLRFLFSKAFGKGGHVPAEGWYQALCSLEQELTKVCKTNPNHRFRKGLRSCPYCATEKKIASFFKNQRK